MIDPTVPSPSETEALVSLRSLLGEAMQRSSDRSITGRHVATILLDGAAEAAIGVCRSKFLQSPKGQESLDKSYSKLLEALRVNHPDLLGVAAWPEVWRLHRARNAAQHHQIPPDHEVLVRWASSVGSFVDDAVALAFGIRLTRVNRASAIANDDLRATYGTAEDALASGDSVSAVRLLRDAFNDAVRSYKRQHHDAMNVNALRLRDDLGLGEAVSSAVSHLEELLQVAPFTSSLSEYVWWRSLLRNLQYGEDAHIDIDEAHRAATFVLSWILRWEAFAARYADVRRPPIPSRPPPRPSPHPDGSPVVDVQNATVDVEEDRRTTGSPRTERWVLVLPYAVGREGESTSAQLNGWSLNLSNALREKRGGEPWISATTDGWQARVLVTVNPDAFDMKAIVAEIQDRIDDIRALRRQEEAEQAAVRERRAVLEQQMDVVRAELMTLMTEDGEPLFTSTDVRWDTEGPAIVAHLTDARAADSVEIVRARTGTSRVPNGHIMHKALYLRGDLPTDEVMASARELLEVLSSFKNEEMRRLDEQERRLVDLRSELGRVLAQWSREA